MIIREGQQVIFDEARGEKNLKRIQSQVLEEFNQMLFPNEKPQVSHILLKDFAIQ